MTLLDGALGLRISELVAVQCADIDWNKKTIQIQRKFTHGKLGPTNTASSETDLPIVDTLHLRRRCTRTRSTPLNWHRSRSSSRRSTSHHRKNKTGLV